MDINLEADHAESVVKEMRHLHDNHAIDHIVFYDATFNHDKDRVKQISKILIENPVNVTWRARVRADKIDEEMVSLMKQSGCVELSLGVETGSERMLQVLKKNETLGQIRTAFKIIQEHGLWCSGYFMFGIPGETRNDAKKTIEFAIELDPDWALFSAATPFPGTEFFSMVEKNIATVDMSQYKFNFDLPVISYDNFPREQIARVIRTAYSRFYLRKDWIMNRIKKANDTMQIENIINSYMFYAEKHKQGASGQASC